MEPKTAQPGRLFLIPSALGDEGRMEMPSPWLKQQVKHLRIFIVESEKPGRAAIKTLQIDSPQSELELHLLNEHTPATEKAHLLEPLLAGHDVGLISDAGMPCVADPGADMVALAHQKGIPVFPLPGASSLLMALMASGMNGQGFVFHGYLPIGRGEREKKLKELERDARQKKQTQIFIEAPYRNNHMLESIVKNCQPDMRLCVAANLTQPGQVIISRSIGAWKKEATVDFHKQPAVFLLGIML